MADDDDDEEEHFGSIYENGHWEWDDCIKGLQFVSDFVPEVVENIKLPLKTAAGTVEFHDDVDVLEQVRFRRRYQRKLKAEEEDVITIQDLKDIAIFTAPMNIMSAALIDFLHIPTTERFIRALIFYLQYFLQIQEAMEERLVELESKIRTPVCDIIENEMRDDLSDLRLILAKEYCTMLIGGADTRKYHHMGPSKKSKSLSFKDIKFFETFLRLCVQIVWLAFGRNYFNKIELETHRIFKSEIFNSVEHTIQTGIMNKMSSQERGVLIGACLRRDKKMTTRSPLMNEVQCHRPIDYRTLGIGVIECPKITTRLRFILLLITAPEEEFLKHGVSLGIVGRSRSAFDTLLHPLPTTTKGTKSRFTTTSSYISSSKSARKSSSRAALYEKIVLPPRDVEGPFYPAEFPFEEVPPRPCNEEQRLRWQKRLKRQSTFFNRKF